jgi:MFS family permease
MIVATNPAQRPLDPPVTALALHPSTLYFDSFTSHLDLENGTTNDPGNIAEPLPVTGAPSKEWAKSIPPPDVGLWPWLQVLAGFFMMFNSWGIVISFGSFQTYYAHGGLTTKTSDSTIAWIGSIQVFIFAFFGSLSGKFFDAGYYKLMIWTGSFLIVFGTMTISLADKYYQFMLAQGLCVGFGMALLFVTTLGLPATWFVKHRGLAIGIITTGSATAGIIFPIMLERLINEVGFPWAVRIQGFISLATLGCTIPFARQRLPPRKRGGIIEYQALKEPAFALYTLGMLFTFLGLFMFYGFVEDWVLASNLDLKGLDVSYIIPIMNAGGFVGRIALNWASDYVGPLNVQGPAVLLSGILVLTWISVHNIGGLLATIILYGVFSGGVMTLPTPAVATMTKDMTHVGARLGVVCVMIGFGSLIGNPVTGAIIQSQHDDYDGARLWSGIMILVGVFLVGCARVYRTGFKLVAKA